MRGKLWRMVLEKGPEPLYQQLARILRQKIESGELPARSQVPSLVALQDEYQVSDGTARRAIDVLEKAGLVVTTPGLGTFVAG